MYRRGWLESWTTHESLVKYDDEERFRTRNMLLLLLRANTFLTLWLFVLASKSGESLQHLHMVALDFRRSILQLSPCIFPWKLMSSCYVNLHANEYHQPDEDILIAYICIQGTHLHSRFNHLNVLCNLTRRVPIWLPCTYAKWMPWVFEEILALLLGVWPWQSITSYSMLT